MPPGWASKWTNFTAARLWHKVNKVARQRGTPLAGLVVTSPHYLDLVKRVGSLVPCFYYCSDDYTQYTAWGGDALLKQEAELVRTVRHSFFVSRTLADRAVKVHGVPEDCVSVSPNATEEKFLMPVSEEQIDSLFHQFPALKRPLVGVVGGINDRLDFDLIARCAALPEVGSVVLVGGVDAAAGGDGMESLQADPRCIFVGQRPHDELPVWMQALDVALIPYRDTPLNRSCSPMRLFDHLASGRRIVATQDCAQVTEMSSWVDVGHDADDICRLLIGQIRSGTGQPNHTQQQMATDHLWSSRAKHILRCMTAPLS